MIASVPFHKAWKKTLENTKTSAPTFNYNISPYSTRIQNISTGIRIGDTLPPSVIANCSVDDLKKYYDCNKYELGKCLTMTPHFSRNVSTLNSPLTNSFMLSNVTSSLRKHATPNIS